MSAPLTSIPPSVAQLTQRSLLRRQLLATRAALPNRAALDAALCDKLSAWLQGEVASHAQCIALYWPIQGEIDVRAPLEAWRRAQAGRLLALPKVVTPQAPLTFLAWQADAPMQNGRYNIPIPAQEIEVLPDVCLMPCVGFGQAGDARWYRLGYGGGFYDRTLAAWQAQRQQVFTLGIAHAASQVAGLRPDRHDQPLDSLLTEQGSPQ